MPKAIPGRNERLPQERREASSSQFPRTAKGRAARTRPAGFINDLQDFRPLIAM
jgi:hypothetical protein